MHRPRGSLRSHDPLSTHRWVRAQGPYVWDDQGHRYIDFIGGYSACILGHQPPAIVEAATSQLQKISFAHSGNSEERALLEASLAERFPFSQGRTFVWLTNGGARAVEIAWKIASSQRPGGVVRFDLGYHGRSLATARISDTRCSSALSDAACSVHTIPFPIVDREVNGSIEEACTRALEAAYQCIDRHADDIAMLIMEPAIGSRGYHFAPASFFRAVAAMAKARGIVVVSDEIQMGLGRMGAWSVAIHDAWDPDLIVLGKSLGSGVVPLAAVLGSESLMQALPEGIESETYAGMPFSCAIGNAVLRQLDSEGCVATSEARGEQTRAWLRALLPSNLCVEGRGLATVISFSGDAETRSRTARNWVSDLSQAGLLVHLTGQALDRLALIPPLNVSRDVLREAVDIVARKGHVC